MFGHGATFHPANVDLSYSEARQSALSSLRPAALGQRMGRPGWLLCGRELACAVARWPGGWLAGLAGNPGWPAAWPG